MNSRKFLTVSILWTVISMAILAVPFILKWSVIWKVVVWDLIFVTVWFVINVLITVYFMKKQETKKDETVQNQEEKKEE